MFEFCETVRDAEMSGFTTLKLGGPADVMAFPSSAEEISALIREAKENGIPVMVIGHGSNLLVLDGGIRGLVIQIGRRMSAIHAEGETLTAQAGAMMGSAAAAAMEAGLTGLEFASGIPGTVGGGVVMNAGAYGGEMAQVVTGVTGVMPDGSMKTLGGAELDFRYRHSRIPETGMTVTEVTFRLQRGEKETIRARMAELNAARAEKQPLDVPSAGSTFKRPEGYYAAALIDRCGLKGYAVGGARVSPKHAGFLVNTGKSAADYLNLMRYVRHVVQERTGVLLEPEIRIVGEET